MDTDSIRTHSQYLDTFKDFLSGDAQVLIGTQMIAQGLHFPRVGFVGVISPDNILNLPDFRASERTYELLTHVAGRAGRANCQGEVVIQTYNSQHYAIQSVRLPYKKFYEKELAYRKAMNYPPFTRLIRILIEYKNETSVKEKAKKVREFLERNNIDFIGPVKCVVPKISGRYRYHFLIRTNDMKIVCEKLRKLKNVKIDIDPQELI